MNIDLAKLTPAQQTAVRTGDLSVLSQSEKDSLISLFKADGYSVTSNGKDSIFSKKAVTQSSQAFYKDQNSLIADMTALGTLGAKKYAETGDRKVADRLFYKSETGRLQNAVAPDVTKDVFDTKPVYDNNQDPTSFHNQDDCTLGVLKQNESEIMKYLENSRDPRLSDLAKKSQGGDLASTYALIGIVDSWQPDMEKNAKDGKLTVDTATNVGGQPLKTDKTWVVPAEFCSEEDFKLIEKKNQSDKPPVDNPPGSDGKIEFKPEGESNMIFSRSDSGPALQYAGKVKVPKAFYDMVASTPNAILAYEDSSTQGVRVTSYSLGAADYNSNHDGYASIADYEKAISKKYSIDYKFDVSQLGDNLPADFKTAYGLKVGNSQDPTPTPKVDAQGNYYESADFGLIQSEGLNDVRIGEDGKPKFFKNSDPNYTGGIPLQYLFQKIPVESQ